jgi:outer membrane translocation and assembly module TamA
MYNYIKYGLSILVLFVFSHFAYGQNNYTLKLHFDKKSKDVLKIKAKNEFKDSVSVTKEINSFKTKLQSIGYIEASLDSSVWNDKSNTTYITLNQQYIWSEISNSGTDWKNLPNLNYRYRDFNMRKFNYRELLSLEEAIIKSLEDSGYPFASVSLKDIKINNNKISASLKIDKGKLFTIDTIILKEYKDINIGFIQQSIGVFIGEEYNESKVKIIDKQLDRLNFARVSKGSEVEFINDKATINIYLQKQSSNQFDGIVGFQPAANSTGKMMITGQLNLKLNNLLKHGERISLNWESPGNQSQNLDVNLNYPYLLGSPFGAALGFKLNKRDTSFLNVETRPAIIFAWSPTNSISTYGNFLSSKSLGSSSKNSYKNRILDLNYNAFGIAIHLNHLDYPFNPLRGYEILIQADAGKKTISNYYELDNIQKDSINSSEFRLNSELGIKLFVPLGNRNTILISNQSALLISPQLYNNELYRIGGFKKMRGFDEQSIFTNLYSISSLEYHFLLNKNSFLGPFYDFAYIENQVNTLTTGIYQSFGLSFSFATQAGIFRLMYAVGKYPNQSFVFKQAKIHFGYTSVF